MSRVTNYPATQIISVQLKRKEKSKDDENKNVAGSCEEKSGQPIETESVGGSVAVNEEKSRRQIAAAAVKSDMRKVLAMLRQDLTEVENGLKQNMCDETEVRKVKKLIELAENKLEKLPERAPSPEEQAIMSINMLI